MLALRQIPNYNMLMKLHLEINNQTKSPLKDSFFAPIIRETLKRSGHGFLAGKTVSMSIALVDKQEIKRLNKNYRKVDKTTDVLSFAEYENTAALERVVEKDIFLGELIVCYDDIKEYAAAKKLDLKRELANVIAHGTLHLLGFDHGKEMFKIQEGAVNKKINK